MKWFLTLLVACAVLAAVLHVRHSRRVVTDEAAFTKDILPPPSATPAPVAAAPVEKTPEPPQEIAQLPPSTPAPQLNLATLAQNRALWPKQVLLVKPVVFPVVINQRPMGTVTLAPGRPVDVLAVSPQGLTLAFQGGTRLVPADATNVLEVARRLAPPPVSSGTTASHTDAAAVSPPLSSLAPVRAPNAPPRAVPTPTAPPPIADSQPLESIRHQPSARPASIVPQIHAYLQNKIATTSGATEVPPLDPDPDLGHDEARHLFDALERDPAGLYRLAALVLQRADWLLSQPDPEARLSGVYLASETASSLARAHNPDYLLTSAIYDAYLYPRIELIPVEADFDAQTREGVICDSAILFAHGDLIRSLQYCDLRWKYAKNADDKDYALYEKAYALHGAHRTKEALEIWSQLRNHGPAGWMKKQIAEAWKIDAKNEQSAAKNR